MNLPLLFAFNIDVLIDGRLFRVSPKGKVLLREHESGIAEMTAVDPAGWIGLGENRAEALDDFRNATLAIISGIVDEVDSVEGFSREMDEMFRQRHQPWLDEWLDAVQFIRESGHKIDWLEAVKDGDKSHSTWDRATSFL